MSGSNTLKIKVFILMYSTLFTKYTHMQMWDWSKLEGKYTL